MRIALAIVGVVAIIDVLFIYCACKLAGEFDKGAGCK